MTVLAVICKQAQADSSSGGKKFSNGPYFVSVQVWEY